MQRIRIPLILVLLLAACAPNRTGSQVVIYTSVDQVYAEPVLMAFEKQTGIRVLPVYDVEATKTVGLVQRLLSEKSNPRADVFWSGEFTQTMLLKSESVLASYRSPSASSLPETYNDPDGTWSAFGGRARVILINTDRMKSEEIPHSMSDILSDRFVPDQIGMANPLFGTTLTHAAALYAWYGPNEASKFFQHVADQGVRIVDGNSVVRDMVASGQLTWGLTDTDDACGAIQKGDPVKVIFPDQSGGQAGTLIIPNTVALIAGSPNPDMGKNLIDYLLDPAVEADLVEAGWIQIPSRELPAGIEPLCYPNLSVEGMQVGFEEIYRSLDLAQDDLREKFLK